jgi:hypothetical protein
MMQGFTVWLRRITSCVRLDAFLMICLFLFFFFSSRFEYKIIRTKCVQSLIFVGKCHVLINIFIPGGFYHMWGTKQYLSPGRDRCISNFHFKKKVCVPCKHVLKKLMSITNHSFCTSYILYNSTSFHAKTTNETMLNVTIYIYIKRCTIWTCRIITHSTHSGVVMLDNLW